ncbi:hypothetical protein [Riemerella columbipharyngis]|uniref:Uncharacterized protein n=1 Tax=Riemerella columbipharyngis TaxID=1071918 RepID=A0A1G6YJB9_9FLAO|nr:hypothetical protein [Riemerella columbipharyngis]SDD89646.1 hypothetical protein SAMN05421544_101161 [Riemerella columbipharyngis]
MDNSEKIKQLRKYKTIATGLFLLMAAVFIIASFYEKRGTGYWAGYIRTFSEAAMVGALAD